MATHTAPALRDLLATLAPELARVEAEMARMLADPEPSLRALVGHVSRYGGKRLRPALALLAGRMFGPLGPEHVTVAAIVEVIHTATLVHDDILDEASLRRRLSTVNAEVGNETAVMLGDYLFSTAFKEAAAMESRFPSRYLAEMVGIVCRGEILQNHHRHDADLPEETYFRIIRDKTAALYAAALRTGAHLSGASEADQSALADFGMKMGSAFQVVDDVLDLVGQESRVGKSLGTDLEKAKLTLPLIRLRDRGSDADRVRFRAALAESSPARRKVALEKLLEKSDAVASARETAADLVAQARQSLATLPESDERTLLDRACEYVLARTR